MNLPEAINRIAGSQGQITFMFSPDRVIVETLNPHEVFEENIKYAPDDPEGISVPAALIKIAKKIK